MGPTLQIPFHQRPGSQSRKIDTLTRREPPVCARTEHVTLPVATRRRRLRTCSFVLTSSAGPGANELNGPHRSVDPSLGGPLRDVKVAEGLELSLPALAAPMARQAVGDSAQAVKECAALVVVHGKELPPLPVFEDGCSGS